MYAFLKQQGIVIDKKRCNGDECSFSCCGDCYFHNVQAALYSPDEFLLVSAIFFKLLCSVHQHPLSFLTGASYCLIISIPFVFCSIIDVYSNMHSLCLNGVDVSSDDCRERYCLSCSFVDAFL